METLDDLKKTVDKMAREQKDAQEIKDAITLQADNDQEAPFASYHSCKALDPHASYAHIFPWHCGKRL